MTFANSIRTKLVSGQSISIWSHVEALCQLMFHFFSSSAITHFDEPEMIFLHICECECECSRNRIDFMLMMLLNAGTRVESGVAGITCDECHQYCECVWMPSSRVRISWPIGVSIRLARKRDWHRLSYANETSWLTQVKWVHAKWCCRWSSPVVRALSSSQFVFVALFLTKNAKWFVCFFVYHVRS